ncbi:ABC transporter ATP-binding protein, partial [Clostridium botulinum]|uniref:ABC transporter ATP-binding protein n=1 Tax=Clostridium botulinum TaxID=1491 RepID=UPI00217CE233
KQYDDQGKTVLKNVTAKIETGEFFVIVGPSGCGKSTLLRMIAGLTQISNGEISIDGQIVNNLPPKDRNLTMVFQSYALFPFLSVWDNVAFGLRARKHEQSEIEERVNNALKMVNLEELKDRKPRELSGGQRQRVALARAVASDAKICLMDEPLSNLDAQLRIKMRQEIYALQRKLGIILIYVTHDQVEAMTMADRIVIMNDGMIQQVGTPAELYSKPANKFVAGFIGSPATNFFDVKLVDGKIVNDQGLNIAVPEGQYKVLEKQGYVGKELTFGIRPEDVHAEEVAIQAFPDALINAKIQVSELLGAESILYSKVGGTDFVAKVDSRDHHKPGDDVQMAFEMTKAHYFDKDTDETIL